MVLETIPDKNFGTNWKLREQQAKQAEENFLRSRKNIQNRMAEYAMLTRKRNRLGSVDAPRVNFINSQIGI